jgi:hypothetical protein
MSAPVEHRGPWRVDDRDAQIVDADGATVLMPGNYGNLIFDTPTVREMVRAAPEMEALLREIITRLDQRPGDDIDRDTCPLCGKFHHHAKDCPYALGEELLARIDTARNA